MNRKYKILLVYSLFLLIFLMQNVSAEDCCVSQENGCIDDLTQSECDGQFISNFACYELESVNINVCVQGCCCESPTPETVVSDIKFSIQCQAEFSADYKTEESCNTYCGTLSGIDAGDSGDEEPVVVDESDVIQPDEPVVVDEPEEPILPDIPYYATSCGNNVVDSDTYGYYEECDGEMDTIEEGALRDCENRCGLYNACRCPVSCLQQPSSPILQSVNPESGELAVELRWSFPTSSCTPQAVFLERCDGYCAADDNWYIITNPLSIQSYVDETLELDIDYSYRVGAYYEMTNTVQVVYSNIISVPAMVAECIYSDSFFNQRFCKDDQSVVCTNQNYVQVIQDCGTGQKCVSGSCVNEDPCYLCSEPFGIFIAPACAYAFCYQDRSDSVVDTYFSCNNLESCYDYKTEDACSSDLCSLDCEWSGYSDLNELGIGVCRPTQEYKQDCTKCSDLPNGLFSKCTEPLCDAVGDNCYFTGYEYLEQKCVKDTELSCAYYNSEQECVGSNPISIDLETDADGKWVGDNSVIEYSDDLFELGTCKWSPTGCIKDYDGDGDSDCWEGNVKCLTDNQPPETFVQPITILPGEIDLPFSVYDSKYSLNDGTNEIVTYFSIEKEWNYPENVATGNTFSYLIPETGHYILTYFSKDGANNLETVKSMNIFVDTIPPEVEIVYDYIPQEFEEDVWKSRVYVTVSATDNVDEQVTCTAVLVKGNEIYSAINDLDETLLTERVVHYTDIMDGNYLFVYECKDKSNNVFEGIEIISVSGDTSVKNPMPAQTINFHEGVTLSVESVKNSECRYSNIFNDFDLMDNFESDNNNLDKKFHSSIININPMQQFHKYYVKCKLDETGLILGGTNDQIRFTLDEEPPVTKIEGLQGTCAANWLHEDFVLNFNCQDPYQRKEGYPPEFGCDKTMYCIGQNCNPADEFVASRPLQGINYVNYYSIDNGGNAETIKRDVVRIDKEEPTLTVSWINSNGVVDRSNPEPYIIQLISSKPLERVSEFGFMLPSGEIISLPDPYPVTFDKLLWQTYLLPTELSGLNTQAFFEIDADAEHNWKINSIDQGRTFYISTLSEQSPISLSLVGDIEIDELLSNGEVIDYVYENGIYYLSENLVTLNGTIRNLQDLRYFISDVVENFEIENGEFEFNLELFELDGAEIETSLYMIGEDIGNNVYVKELKFVIDKQGPKPVSYELLESEDETIKTPLPTIIVEFGEEVEIVDYGLLNFDVEFEVTELSDRIYEFKVIGPLSNGCYKFYVNAEDVRGNQLIVPYEIAFGIDASETRIILENPHHGSAKTSNLELQVKTTWAANCKYGYDDPDSFDYPLLMNFETTGLLDHTKSNFNVDRSQPFYVICDDGREVIKESFMLNLDQTEPVILRAEADPVIVSQQPLNTKLVVETNEEFTICKYSKTSTDYSQMRFFPGESYNFLNTYKKVHELALSYDTSPISESFNVQCEDVAGHLSDIKVIEVKVEDQALVITVNSPPIYTSQRDIDLNISTNEEAICRYQNTTEQLVDITTEPSKQHSVSLGRFRPGTYTFDLDCYTLVGVAGAERETANLMYTFTVDITEPILSSVSGGNYSCPVTNNSYVLGISFNAYDNESGIIEYIFDVIDSEGNEIIANETSTTNNLDLEDLELFEGEKYKVVATAFNGAGLESKSKKSDYIIAKSLTDVECRERNPPTIGFNVMQSMNGVTVVITCNDESGCDSSSMAYGTTLEGDCAPVNPYGQQVELFESSYFCGKACDTLGNCNTKIDKIDVLSGDEDSDGVIDNVDNCPNTLGGEAVDQLGCSESQRYVDSDGDGVRDQLDYCPNTPQGQVVDSQGCPKETGRIIPEVVPEGSLLGTIILAILLLGVLGIGSYFVYVKYYLEKIEEKIVEEVPIITTPIRRVWGQSKFDLEKLAGVRKGEDIFDKLDRTTKGNLFERLSGIVRKEEEDVFTVMEKLTKSGRRTISNKKDDVFEQMYKAISVRGQTKQEVKSKIDTKIKRKIKKRRTKK